MVTAVDRRPEFTPPPEPGLLRSVSLAVAAHALLVLALSWGITWKRQDDNAVVEAELWSSTVQQAAPKPVEPPPAPPPPPAPAPVVQPPAPPVQREADIALEKERERKAAQEKERERKAAEEKKREEAARLRKQELEKRELARKAAEEKKRVEQAKAEQRRKEEQVALEKMRKENLERIAGLAGATGSPSSTGTALRSSAPSSSYAGRVRARVKPNIVYTDNVGGNPSAEIEVRLGPDGTVVSRKLSKPSGVPGWDEAVLRAIDRTDQFPRDVDGRVPSSMILVFRPKDL